MRDASRAGGGRAVPDRVRGGTRLSKAEYWSPKRSRRNTCSHSTSKNIAPSMSMRTGCPEASTKTWSGPSSPWISPCSVRGATRVASSCKRSCNPKLAEGLGGHGAARLQGHRRSPGTAGHDHRTAPRRVATDVLLVLQRRHSGSVPRPSATCTGCSCATPVRTAPLREASGRGGAHMPLCGAWLHDRAHDPPPRRLRACHRGGLFRRELTPSSGPDQPCPTRTRRGGARRP